jgi:2-polyprenyl-3-methyl-5-hydroxy-6-metoxy-1,4-benzoquinol methylase
MDDAALPAEAHALALSGLARLNRISLSGRSIWQALTTACIPDTVKSRELTLLDLATGGGDLPVALGLRAKRRGIALSVTGADKSQCALQCARALARRAGISVEWIALDLMSDPIPASDWITCSLFLHHLDDLSVVDLLRAMAQAARLGIIINDLERTSWNRLLVWLGARLLTRSAVVHRDSDRSMCASFTLTEIRQLADAAGLTGHQLERRFPCRWQMVWKKPQ